MRSLSLLCFLVVFSFQLHAQMLKGVLVSKDGPLVNGQVSNIHTSEEVFTDAGGNFSIKGTTGQLIEFRKPGFKTARVRVGAASVPFYRIVLEQGVQELDEVMVRSHYQDFKHDSMRYHELFKKQLEFPKMSTLQSIQSPFSALSKKNRQLWAFQEEYAWFEEQKFVDYHFNEKLVANLTGLTGDSAKAYIRKYRPSAAFIRSVPEYEYFRYIKNTVEIWRRRQKFGTSGSRSGG